MDHELRQVFAIIENRREIEKAKQEIRDLKFALRELIKEVKQETLVKIKAIYQKIKDVIGAEALNKVKWRVKKMVRGK